MSLQMTRVPQRVHEGSDPVVREESGRETGLEGQPGRDAARGGE